MPCPLDGKRQGALMFCAVSRNPSRKDLASLGDISLELVSIFVADSVIGFSAENADFLSSVESARPSLEPTVVSSGRLIVSHGLTPFQYDQLNGSSSSIPSGIFMKPSPDVSGAGAAEACGAGAEACAGAEYPAEAPFDSDAALLSANS